MVSGVLAAVSVASLLYPSSQLAFWRNFLEGNLGWTAFLAPVVFLVAALVLQKLKFALAQANVLVGLLTIMISISALTSPVISDQAGDLGNLV